MTKRQHRIWVELKLPTKTPDRIARIGAILAAVDGKADYKTLQPIIDSLKPLYQGLQAAVVDAASGTIGLATARDLKLRDVMVVLETFRAGLQALANGDMVDGVALVENALFCVRSESSRAKPPFAVEPGPVSGTVRVIIRAVAKNAAYHVEWSADGGKSWNKDGQRRQSERIIRGLPVGVLVLIRWAAVLKDGQTDWSEPLGVLVK